MDMNADIVKRLEAMFPDKGVGLLRRAELPDSWEKTIAATPEVVIPKDPFIPGVYLARLRDHQLEHGRLRSAGGLTHLLCEYHRRGAGKDHQNTIYEMLRMGEVFELMGEADKGRAAILAGWQRLVVVAPPESPLISKAAVTLGRHYHRSGDLDRAARALQKACDSGQAHAPEEVGLWLWELAEIRGQQDMSQEALKLMNEALDWSVETRGREDVRTIRWVQAIVSLLAHMRRIGEAVYYLDGWHDALLALPEDGPAVETRVQMGVAYHSIGRTEEAYRLIDAAVNWTREHQEGPETPHLRLSSRLVLLATLMDTRGHTLECEGLLHEALDADQRLHGMHSAQTAIRYAQLAEYCCRYSRYAESIGWFEMAVTSYLEVFGTDDERTQAVGEKLVSQLVDLAKREAAREGGRSEGLLHLDQARHWGLKLFGGKHPVMNLVRNTEI